MMSRLRATPNGDSVTIEISATAPDEVVALRQIVGHALAQLRAETDKSSNSLFSEDAATVDVEEKEK